MRVLSLIALVNLVSSFEATSAGINLVKADVNSGIAIVGYGQLERSLRRREDAELVESDLNSEERGGVPGAQLIDDALNKVDDVFNKVDDVFNKNVFDDVAVKAAQTTEKLPNKWIRAVAANRVRQKYPEGLTPSTMKQLVKVEIQNMDDIFNNVKMSKTGNYKMQRDIPEFPGMKVAPILVSNTGRATQRYTDEGGRMLVMGVTTRKMENGADEVLFISSSNPKKSELILPKGGWDKQVDPNTVKKAESAVTSESVKKAETALASETVKKAEAVANAETVAKTKSKTKASFVDETKLTKSSDELAAGETKEQAVLREVLEEAGYLGQIKHFVGTMVVEKDGKRQLVKVFWLDAVEGFHQWPESIRKRVWAQMDDALKLAKGRPENLAALEAVNAMSKRVARGELPPMDPALSKVPLMFEAVFDLLR